MSLSKLVSSSETYQRLFGANQHLQSLTSDELGVSEETIQFINLSYENTSNLTLPADLTTLLMEVDFLSETVVLNRILQLIEIEKRIVDLNKIFVLRLQDNKLIADTSTRNTCLIQTVEKGLTCSDVPGELIGNFAFDCKGNGRYKVFHEHLKLLMHPVYLYYITSKRSKEEGCIKIFSM
jgi:hypothetical protein